MKAKLQSHLIRADMRKCCPHMNRCTFFCSHREVKAAALWPQRNNYCWSLAAASAHCSVSVPLMRTQRCCRTHCWRQILGREESLNIQRWGLERTCGALRHMQLSCGCWTQSFTWWRSWRSGWVSGLRVSGSFQCSCTTWLPWQRSWTGLRLVQDWTTSASSTRWGLIDSSADQHWSPVRQVEERLCIMHKVCDLNSNCFSKLRWGYQL